MSPPAIWLYSAQTADVPVAHGTFFAPLIIAFLVTDVPVSSFLPYSPGSRCRETKGETLEASPFALN